MNLGSSLGNSLADVLLIGRLLFGEKPDEVAYYIKNSKLGKTFIHILSIFVLK